MRCRCVPDYVGSVFKGKTTPPRCAVVLFCLRIRQTSVRMRMERFKKSALIGHLHNFGGKNQKGEERGGNERTSHKRRVVARKK